VADGAKYLLIAHNHPCVQLDGVRMKCWLIGKLNKKASKKFRNWRSLKHIVMPAFSDLVGCSPVNALNRGEGMLGPMFKNNIFKRDEVQVYLLDGTPLGCVRDLRLH